MERIYTYTFKRCRKTCSSMDIELLRRCKIIKTFLKPCHLEIPSVVCNDIAFALAIQELKKFGLIFGIGLPIFLGLIIPIIASHNFKFCKI